MAGELTWHAAAKVSAVQDDEVVGVVVADRTIAVYYAGGQFYATDGLCTHEQARLCDGFLDGDVIECPKHNARFHVPTGKAVRKPARGDLRTYPVKVVGDEVHVGIEAP